MLLLKLRIWVVKHSFNITLLPLEDKEDMSKFYQSAYLLTQACYLIFLITLVLILFKRDTVRKNYVK